MNGRRFSRRGFLQASAAVTAPLLLLPPGLRAEGAARKTIRLGHIGTGGQGTALLRNFLSVDIATSAAICDPYRRRREAAAKLVKDAQGHEPALHADFRELLADPSIDAVVIATPDHWHVPVGLAAVRAGKDVYIEKPLGLSLNQNRAMLEACRATGRIFQYGTQQRSQELIRRGVELVLNGRIGDLQRVEVWAPAGRGGGSLEEIPVPEGLDYDLYIGPAPMRPCTKDRITSLASYHCSDYSIGFIAGWGAHPLDVAVWAMDSDLKGPVTFKGAGDFPTPAALFNNCASWDVDVRFGDGVTMKFTSHEKAEPVVKKYRDNWNSDGTTFFGTQGWISLSRGGVAASDMDWFKQVPPEGARRVPYHNRYYRSFVECVRDRTPSISPVDHAVRSDAISHLSLLAIRSGAEVSWDPKAYRIVSPEKLNGQMAVPVRGDWKAV